jgi:SAM-dependent methyltransferase
MAPEYFHAGDVAYDAWGSLAALRLPDLSGRTFLDASCKDGFFCAFALWAGASRVVGLDRDPASVARVRERFPQVEVEVGSLNWLPEGPFDVILLAYALQQAENPEALIAGLVDALAPNGVLVLETPVLTQVPGEEFVVLAGPSGAEIKVPQSQAIRRVCADRGFTFRMIGGSVARGEGDAIVYHLGRPVRNAWLLLEPSSSGKTTKAHELAHIPGAELVSGDWELVEILRDPSSVSPALAAALEGVTSSSLNLAYEAILDAGLEHDFVEVLLREVSPAATPILDVYVPRWGHARLIAAVRQFGFNPIVLSWSHPLTVLGPVETDRRLAEFRQWAKTTWGPEVVNPVWDLTVGEAAAQRDLAAGERDLLAAERNQLMAERDRLVGERDAVVVERDRVVSLQNRVVVERDQALLARDRAAAERDGLVAERDRLVAERDAVAAERDRLAGERDEALELHERAIDARDGLAADVAAMRQSRSWRYTSWLRHDG